MERIRKSKDFRYFGSVLSNEGVCKSEGILSSDTVRVLCFVVCRSTNLWYDGWE